LYTSADSLLDDLRCEGTQLWLEQGQLRFRAPVGVLTLQRKAAIHEFRTDVIEAVSARCVMGSVPPVVAEAEDVWLPTAGQEAAARTPELQQSCQVQLWNGRIDAAAVQATLNELAHRHSVLRTRYTLAADGRMWATTPGKSAITVQVESLESLEQTRRLPQARIIATRSAQVPFDVYTGPLVRMTVLRLSEQQSVTVLAINHSVFDAWSLGVFASEFHTLYASFMTGRVAPLKPVAMQFSDFARQQNQWLESAAALPHILYWRDRIRGGSSPFLLPQDGEPGIDAARVGLISAEVAAQTTGRIRQIARDAQTSTFSCLAAALGIVLGAWSGNDDVFLWILHSGRPSSEFTDVIGFCADSWLLRMDLSGSPRFTDVVASVKQEALNALPHIGVTPGTLQPMIKRAGNGQVHPAIILNFLPAVGVVQARDGDRDGPVQLDWAPPTPRFEDDSPFGIVVNMYEGPGSFAWWFRRKTAAFSDASVRRAASVLRDILDMAANDPNTAVTTLQQRTWGRSAVDS
jgi:hypothetical protein